jgi:hypothetical protein
LSRPRKNERRCASQWVTAKIDLRPSDALAPPSSKSFHDGFLAGKPSSESLGRQMPSLHRPRPLPFGEDAVEKSVTMGIQHSLDSWDHDKIDSMGSGSHRRPAYPSSGKHEPSQLYARKENASCGISLRWSITDGRVASSVVFPWRPIESLTHLLPSVNGASTALPVRS